jgi:hypothetical protein
MFWVQSLISRVGHVVLVDEGSEVWMARQDKRGYRARRAPRARRGWKAGLDPLGRGATKVSLDALVRRAQGGQRDRTARRVTSFRYCSRLFITMNTFIVVLTSLDAIRGPCHLKL